MRVSPTATILDSATNIGSYTATQRNYRWRRSYGSARYSILTNERGPEPLKIQSITQQPDGQSVKLTIENMIPVDQADIKIHLDSANANTFAEKLYWTINQMPNQ